MSYFVPEPSNFSEFTRLPADFKNNWLKATLKDIKKIINNQNFLMDYPEKVEPVISLMDFYKAKIQSDGILDQLKFRTVVRGDFQNKEIILDTCSPTTSMRTLKYFLENSSKHKARVHQLDFIGAFIQANVKHRVFVQLDSRYG